MSYGLTTAGFVKKRLAQIKAEQENSLIAEFGEINVQPQSVFGQIIGVMSKTIADLWEEMQDVYFSQYPSTAEGVALDYLVNLNGIVRLSQERTRVIGVCQGIEATVVPQGALARQPTSQEVFFAEEDTTITSGSLALSLVSVDALAGQVYNCLINNISHIYSLPKIEFDALFVTSNSTVVSINGTELSAVPFNTDSQTTIEDIATAIQTLSEVSTATTRLGLVINFDADFVTSNSILATINSTPLTPVPFNSDQATTIGDLATEIQGNVNVTSCTVTGAREITIVPVDEASFLVNSIVTTGGASQPNTIDQRIDIVADSGSSVTVNYATTTGGASQPNAAISHLTPSTINSVVAGLTAIINNSSEPITATDNLDGTLDILADDSEVPYSLSLSANMTIQEIRSPVVFLSQEFGSISAPVASLTEILTPIAGWQSITNLKAGVEGRDTETDAELRIRRNKSLKILGAGTVEAIRARLLAITNVTAALIYENHTMTEEDLIVIFTSDLITGNQITFTVNGVVQSAISFTTNHLTTMQLIKVQLEALTEIDTVTIGGTGNRTLTIELTQGYDVDINDIDITGGASQTTWNIQGGRHPKSFESVVQGGTDEDVANAIWLTKPAGIQTFGNTSYTIEDSMGNQQVMNFTRPTPIYIWVTVDLTLNTEETFPTNGTNLVEQAIVDYGDTLNIGDDVLIERVKCQIFEVTGIKSGSMQIAYTLNEGDSPSFGTSDITIGESEIAVFSLNRTDAVVV